MGRGSQARGLVRAYAGFAAALIAFAAVAPAASAKTKTKTVSSGAVNVAFGGSGEVQHEMRLPKKLKGGRIKDLDVGVRITHADTSALEVYISGWLNEGGALVGFVPQDFPLLSPDFGSGSCEAGGVSYTVFDEDSPVLIGSSGTANPYVGTFHPWHTQSEPGLNDAAGLAGLEGWELSRRLSLSVIDWGSPPKGGTINCWYATIRYRPDPDRKPEVPKGAL